MALDEALGVTVRKTERIIEKCINPLIGGSTIETATPASTGIYTLGEFLPKGEPRYYHIQTKVGQRVVVRGLLQSQRMLPDANGQPVETSNGLAAFTLTGVDMSGDRVGSKPARQRDIPGSSAVLDYLDTTGDGFNLQISDNYDAVNPDMLFAIDIEDAGDGAAIGDSNIDAPAPMALDSNRVGHFGHEDKLDVWRVALDGWQGAVSVNVTTKEADYRLRTKVLGERDGASVALQRSGGDGVMALAKSKPDEPLDALLIRIESREASLNSRFTEYEVSVFTQD